MAFEKTSEVAKMGARFPNPALCSLMKLFFKIFFRTLRVILGPILLLSDWLTSPRGIRRSADRQQQVDTETGKLALYQFRTCPFCIKTRRAMKRLSLNIELLDAQKNPEHREALLQGGGQLKVPCLRISDDQGQVSWMYESDDIIDYLNQRFGTEAAEQGQEKSA